MFLSSLAFFLAWDDESLVALEIQFEFFVKQNFFFNEVQSLNFLCVNNRCEAFSTYPRTYDLLHAWNIISDVEKKGCSPEDLLLEMDRILRPTGFIIIRDKQSVVDFVKKYLSALHWEAVATGDASSDSEDGEEVVFVVQKKLWLSSRNSRDSE